MSTKYKHSHEVPTAVLAKRLDELSDAIGKPGEERDRELTRRIPAEVDRDADLVLYEASRRLRKMEAERDALAQDRDDWEEIAYRFQRERDALAAKLARYSMCAGRADQRQSESRAVRKALGFNPDADDVSPRDLLDALVRFKAQWQAEVFWEFIEEIEKAGWETSPALVVNALYTRCAELRRQAEEPTE